MLAFAFLPPSVLRLQLNRSKFEGIILPSALVSSHIPAAEAYSNELDRRRRQIPVFIYPDVKTFAAVVRGGRFDPKGKHMLCGAASELADHGIEPMDAARHSLTWRLKLTITGSINAGIESDTGVSDALISSVSGTPAQLEHQFSNPIVKLEDAPYIDVLALFADVYKSGGDKAAVAVVRYLTWSFTATGFKALGGGSFYSLHRAALADKKLMATALTSLSQYIKANAISLPKDLVQKIRSMLTSSIPAQVLEFVKKYFIERRPFSLALAESACSPSIGTVVVNHMKFEDFPLDTSNLTVKPRVDPKASATHIMVRPGQYTLREIFGLISDRPNELYLEACADDSKIAISRTPDGFRNTLSMWDLSRPLELKVKAIRYKLAPEIVEKQVDTAPSGVTFDSSRDQSTVRMPKGAKHGEAALLGSRKRPAQASDTKIRETGVARTAPAVLGLGASVPGTATPKRASETGRATPVEAISNKSVDDLRSAPRSEKSSTPIISSDAPVRARGARNPARQSNAAKPARETGPGVSDLSNTTSTKAIDVGAAILTEVNRTPIRKQRASETGRATPAEATSTLRNTTSDTGRGAKSQTKAKTKDDLTESQLRKFMSDYHVRLTLADRAKRTRKRS